MTKEENNNNNKCVRKTRPNQTTSCYICRDLMESTPRPLSKILSGEPVGRQTEKNTNSNNNTSSKRIKTKLWILMIRTIG